ncbi:MAG: GHKL domain-containing protein [Oscillospiraceae bacterium]|nr:GHKL domain-containing protein [Oscillospiraceae bacterium]
MTQTEYEIFVGGLEVYKILFRTIIIFFLHGIIFRTEKNDKFAAAAAILFTAVNFFAGLTFTSSLYEYAVLAVFAAAYCFVRFKKYYEKAAAVLILYFNFHSLAAPVAVGLCQKLHNTACQRLQNIVNRKLQNASESDLEIIRNYALCRSNLNSALIGAIMWIIFTFIMIFMVFVFVKILKKEIDRYDTVMFSIYAFSAGILASIVLDLYSVKADDGVFYLYDTNKEMLWKIPSVALCIFAGEILMICFRQNYKALSEERRKHFAESRQISAMRQRLEEAENFYANIRKAKHEMKNHLTNIKGLAAGERYEEITGYIQKIDETMQELEYKYVTGNAVIDVIVNDKRRRAEKSKIRFDADFRDFRYTDGISAFDVGIVLSNLLDNAVEACEKTDPENRFISLSLKLKKQFLLIDVKNGFNGIINFPDESRLPISTKPAGARDIFPEHGIGLENVSDIARRYYGGLNIKVNENVFHITVMLQCKTG